MLKKYNQFFSSLLLLTDFVVILGAWIGAYYLRFWGIGVPPPEIITPLKNYLVIALPILFIWPFVMKNMGLYRQRRISSPSSEFFCIVRASILAMIVLIAATFLIRRFEISRLVFIYFWLISVVALSLERWTFRWVLRYFRRKGYNIKRVLIVGAGDLGGRVARKIKENPWTGLELIGYLDDYKPVGVMVEGEKVLGRISAVKNILAEYSVDQVFLALPIGAYRRLLYVVEQLKEQLVNLRVVPDIYHAITLNAGMDDFDGLPIINLTDTHMYGWNVVVKRIIDIIFSSLAIIITAPLMAIIAVIIKINSPGSVFFVQRRYGLDGKVIWVYKFRTMAVYEDGASISQAVRYDPRMTRFGAFLRRTSLDELPQFINVLQGGMSIVGPRPHAVAHNEYYRKLIKSYMLRHMVKPGITGWAQINGLRGNTDTLDKMEKRIAHDLYYIENWSVWLDIKIMWLTIWKGFVNRHAY
jgi:Undecaprenyl-phosphate glucose phosphotransferase